MTINELIATSSVHAFNSGVESGRAMEIERIAYLLEQCAQGDRKTVMITPMLMAAVRGEKDND